MIKNSWERVCFKPKATRRVLWIVPVMYFTIPLFQNMLIDSKMLAYRSLPSAPEIVLKLCNSIRYLKLDISLMVPVSFIVPPEHCKSPVVLCRRVSVDMK